MILYRKGEAYQDLSSPIIRGIMLTSNNDVHLTPALTMRNALLPY